MTLLEGERFIQEALHSGQKIERIVATPAFWQKRGDWLALCQAAGIPTALVNVVQLKMLTKTETPAGVLAVVAKPQWHENMVWRHEPSQVFFGVLAVGLQDPGNVGTLLRTMAAAGGRACWFDPACAEATAPKTIRASAGALYKCPVFEQKDPLRVIESAHKKEIQTVAAVPRKGRPYTAINFTKPTMIVLGGEGQGLSEHLVNKCTQAATIPMPGEMESLNVATAGAIMIYELLRQRRLSGAKRRNLK